MYARITVVLVCLAVAFFWMGCDQENEENGADSESYSFDHPWDVPSAPHFADISLIVEQMRLSDDYRISTQVENMVLLSTGTGGYAQWHSQLITFDQVRTVLRLRIDSLISRETTPPPNDQPLPLRITSVYATHELPLIGWENLSIGDPKAPHQSWTEYFLTQLGWSIFNYPAADIAIDTVYQGQEIELLLPAPAIAVLLGLDGFPYPASISGFGFSFTVLE